MMVWQVDAAERGSLFLSSGSGKRKRRVMGKTMITKWGKEIDPEHILEEYPRPGMKRDGYEILNGYWDYAITESAEFPEEYEGRILVPFSPESVLSGVNRILMPEMFLHYKRELSLNRIESGKRLLLHFGAVDQFCEVYVNGHKLGKHTGGYWHFSYDITDYVQEGENLLQVVVRDLSDSSYEARGKQSLERGGMWYTPQSGIWQSVWMEYVPEHYIEAISLKPDLDNKCLEIQVMMHETHRQSVKLTVLLKDEVILQADGMTGDTCRLELPSCRPWSPEEPVLYDIVVRTGEDEVSSYFAMRKISMERDSKGILRLFLNGKPYFHNGVLDQGYYPDGLYTPPSDEAMVNDILQMKALGFNMLRKHAKIEPDRWYYHCDRLGMLVWQDMINGGVRFKGLINKAASDLPELKKLSRDESFRVFLREKDESRESFAVEVERTIRQLYNYPSIVVWTVFNEAWGEFEERKISELIRKMDSSRLMDQASGWIDQGGGDISSIHNYWLPLKVTIHKDRCVALSEFGGYSWHIADHSWTSGEFGYRMYPGRELLTLEIEKLWRHNLIANIKNGLSATAFTQLSDVEDETNGLLTYDREILKVDPEIMRRINKELLDTFESQTAE